MSSPLSFASTTSFRTLLMGKNLPPYSVPGFYRPQVGDVNYESTIGVSNVLDSPGELINSDPFAQQLYPLNQYGPSGGYQIGITYNNLASTVESNQGEYDPNDTKLDLLNEFFIDTAAVENKYLPQGGYDDMVVIDDVEVTNKIYQPYWGPPSFRPSSYTPYQILFSDNPSGTNGTLSNDSYIARLGAQKLREALQARVDAEIFQNTFGTLNTQAFSDPFQASLIATGQQPIAYRNWVITRPENPLVNAVDFITRLGGAYWPVSPIPGDYFDENQINGNITQQVSQALNVTNQLTGGFLGPILNKFRNPSEIFLSNTGNAQRSVLFRTLDLNRYQPGYNKNYGGILGVAQGVINLAVALINPGNDTLVSSYYVGSRNAEPSTITSPPNQVPVNYLGQQVNAPVYGPSELAILYEGNQNQINFGLGAKTLNDGGTIDGQFVWTSPKYKGAAGYNATPGGGKGSLDDEYNLIRSANETNQSTNIKFKDGSILDQTQRLIDSADNVAGITRLKHVGNAINQVSKVFNDGYKEMTKGSQVVSYKDFATGQEKGIEYCRIFTKDTPYYTYADLQKTDGITTSGRRFTNSVLDNSYNLNIAPLKNPNSTNIIANNGVGKGGYAKKYMFSIENLAWRTSSRPGFTYDELPVCEKGPNGGRVMWFPPYDLKFNDTSNAGWNPTEFMGRPEPIYTYKSTSRTGSISWKIIVDNPSVLNLIVEEQLKGANKERINSIMDSFFAGCVKYDIYELAKKFNRIKSKDLYLIQEKLNSPRLTNFEAANLVRNIEVENTSTNGQTNPNTNGIATSVTPDFSEYTGKYKRLSFYFENDIPKPANTNANYDDLYPKYVGLESSYVEKSLKYFDPDSAFCKQNTDYCDRNRKVKEFFNSVIKYNYKKFTEGESNFITDTDKLFKDLKALTITIKIIGSASELGDKGYNDKLSERRITAMTNFLKTKQVGGVSLKEYFDKKQIIIKPMPEGEMSAPTPEGENALSWVQVNCNSPITGSSENNVNGKVTSYGSQWYSTDAMSCRRVTIGEIEITPIIESEIKPQEIPNPKPTKTITTETIVPKKPKPEKTITQQEKEGISKIVLRNLLTECDYFSMIQEKDPMVYDSIKQKIKYFTPAFHSMTPEGLNSRITFLNQCVRPGETIPVIGTDGKPKYNDALNTSFGAPPVLVLRIGDFYHTKVVADSVAFTYDPLIYDINPEGIGVQPMIVGVTMSIKFIGGHGLAKPVEQLQNALSFNYYANTEIYDERAVWTEDTSKLDKEILQSIVEKEAASKPTVPQNKIENQGGNTIGDVITNIPVTGGQTGETSFQKIMDSLVDNTKIYMENTFNAMEKIVLQTNFGIMQLVSQERNYFYGKSSDENLLIYGKPKGEEIRIAKLFDMVINDVETNNNPITNGLFNGPNNNGYTDKEVGLIKTNLINYINTLKSSLSTTIATITQELVISEQNFVQVIRKCQLVSEKTDGKILESGEPRIYNLSGTDKVTLPASGTDTLLEFNTDFSRLPLSIQEYNLNVLNKIQIYTDDDKATSQYDEEDSDFLMVNKTNFQGIQNKRFYQVISRIFNEKNKREEFKKQIISGELLNNSKLRKKFNNIVDDLSKQYSNEIDNEEDLFKKIKKSKEYKDLTDGITEKMFVKGKSRKFNYTTIPGPQNTQQQQKIKNLYAKTNTNDVVKEWTDKVIFL
jgi:outer membrane protein OmpA-like peptidoglycan-associated protein